MASTRDIKRRITSVSSIQQITKAMEMVASAKLRRAQANVIAARPYTTKLVEVISRILAKGAESDIPMLNPGEGPPAYIVVSSDRGLSGPYNGNLLRYAHEKVQENPGPVITVGRKARDYVVRRGIEHIGEYSLPYEEPRYADATRIMEPLFANFQQGVFGSLHLIYTEFVSVLSHKPIMVQLLPVAELKAPEDVSSAQYLYEPSQDVVLQGLLPRYVNSVVYQGLLEAKASERGAQMTAMKSATENADEMIDKLTLSYNRARQTAITLEILEVVSGAQALEG